jgi:hypothetical protein
VPGRHATVVRAEAGSLTITGLPLGSSNSVRVDNRVLSPGCPEPLADGDDVLLGPGSCSPCISRGGAVPAAPAADPGPGPMMEWTGPSENAGPGQRT